MSGNGASVKNLTLTGVEVSGGGAGTVYSGGVVGESEGPVSRCVFIGSVKAVAGSYGSAGGIVGDAKPDITKCSSAGTVEAANRESSAPDVCV